MVPAPTRLRLVEQAPAPTPKALVIRRELCGEAHSIADLAKAIARSLEGQTTNLNVETQTKRLQCLGARVWRLARELQP